MTSYFLVARVVVDLTDLLGLVDLADLADFVDLADFAFDVVVFVVALALDFALTPDFDFVLVLAFDAGASASSF